MRVKPLSDIIFFSKIRKLSPGKSAEPVKWITVPYSYYILKHCLFTFYCILYLVGTCAGWVLIVSH